ncbi:alanyl-tRNA synthetase domain-containing protein [Thelephora ganbajun]|uniref:Alanyl-tRNA synthetase domain-containing protein n=1 Tax=Thelephora ganbajun TaxID=370292 RepID=A0ACB6ZB39_THEGA|nr:alanyl-tRNA synthetase domain-containing protein [Thelephora ganbajun]
MAAAAIVLSPVKTPGDYHRIVSPTLNIPTDVARPIPVGLLSCQRDPLLRQLDTYAVDAFPLQADAPKKPPRKGAKLPRLEGTVLQVILHDTIIFPEGGGQPSDVGYISVGSSMTLEVFEAKRIGGHAIHSIRFPTLDELQKAQLLLPTGTNVVVTLGDNGCRRRLDHMTLHTSQHLLSAILEQRLQLPTLSWSLTIHPSPCYVEIPRGLTPEEVFLIQEETNALVFEGRRVHIEVEELHVDNIPGVAKLDNGRPVGKALPSDYTGGVKRTVVIDGVDRNPCCGTHLPSLHNLQLFLLPHTEALSRSSTTSARLYFLAGPRLITHLTSTHNQITQASSILSCGAPQVPGRVLQVVEERKAAEKRAVDLESQLVSIVAKELLHSVTQVNGERFSAHVHRNDDPLVFLATIASEFTRLWIASEHTSKQYLLVFTSSPTSQTTTSTTLVLVFGSEDASVKEIGETLKLKLAVKGGGKGPRWSGKWTGVWKPAKEGELVDKAVGGVPI